MMNNLKPYSFFIFFLLSNSFILKSQIDSIVCDYGKCIEYLERIKPALLMDSTGEYGIREAAVEYLISLNCTFTNEIISSFLYYFGKPNSIIFYKNRNNNFANKNAPGERYVRIEYLLNITPKNNRTGQKYLLIYYNKNNRITKFGIFIIDE